MPCLTIVPFSKALKAIALKMSIKFILFSLVVLCVVYSSNGDYIDEEAESVVIEPADPGPFTEAGM